MKVITGSLRSPKIIAIAFAVLALLWTAVRSDQPAKAEPSSKAAFLKLGECKLGVLEMLEGDLDRLDRLVPEPFVVWDYYAGKGAISVWNLDCASAELDSGAETPTQIALISVLIHKPDAPDPAFAYLHNFDFYLHAAQSDNRALVSQMLGLGMPFEYVENITFVREDETLHYWHQIGVPSRRTGGYGITVDAFNQHPPHEHDNSWWHAGGPGTSRLHLQIYEAIDKWCPFESSGCSRIKAESGSSMHAFLGSADRSDGLGIDHAVINDGITITVSRARL